MVAARAGVEPWAYSLRELDWMAQARERELWWHTSYLLAHLSNLNRDPKKTPTPYQPYQFHPMEQQRQKLTPKQSVRYLADLFMQKGKQDGEA